MVFKLCSLTILGAQLGRRWKAEKAVDREIAIMSFQLEKPSSLYLVPEVATEDLFGQTVLLIT
jgi:hypothetical protein